MSDLKAMAEAAARGPRLGRPRDWILGATLLGGLVAAVHWSVGWPALLAPWRDLAPGLIAVLVAMALASYLLRARRFYDYFRPRLAGRFPTLLRLTVLHNTANNLLPMRAGELVFPWLMRRYFGHGLLDATAALVWIRLLDLHLLALAALWVLHQAEPSWLWPTLMLIWIAALGPLAVIGRLGLARRARAHGGRLARLVTVIAAAAPARTATVARLYAATAAIWTLKLSAFAILLHHFVPVDFWRVLAGVMGAELSSILPVHGIAGTGSYELAAVAALVSLGVDPELALAGAVNLHLFLLGVTLLLALLTPLLPGGAPSRAAPSNPTLPREERQ